MNPHDADTADHHHRHGGTGHNADAFPALSVIPGGEADSQIYPVSGKRASSGRIRHAGRVLPEKCEHFHRLSRHSGDAVHRTRCPASSLETADAPVHRRRDHMLHASGAVCILKAAPANHCEVNPFC